MVGFRNDTFANPQGLLAFIQKNNVVWRLRPDQKVLIKGEWDTPLDRLAAAEKILRELANLAKGSVGRSPALGLGRATPAARAAATASTPRGEAAATGREAVEQEPVLMSDQNSITAAEGVKGRSVQLHSAMSRLNLSKSRGPRFHREAPLDL